MEPRCDGVSLDVRRAGCRRNHAKVRLAPFGGVDERVARHEPNERLTVDIHETSRLPISGAVADFNIAPHDGGTELTLHYSYTLNTMGRIAKGYTDKQMRRGIGAMAKGLQQESERLATKS